MKTPAGAPKAPRTRGHDLLMAHFRLGHTQKDLAAGIAAKLGRAVYQSAISRWLSHGYVPRRELRFIIQELTGIPASAWEEPSKEGPYAHLVAA